MVIFVLISSVDSSQSTLAFIIGMAAGSSRVPLGIQVLYGFCNKNGEEHEGETVIWVPRVPEAKLLPSSAYKYAGAPPPFPSSLLSSLSTHRLAPPCPHTPPVPRPAPLRFRGLGLRPRSPPLPAFPISPPPAWPRPRSPSPLALRPFRIVCLAPPRWCRAGAWGRRWRWTRRRPRLRRGWRGTRRWLRRPRGSSWWGTRSRRRRPRASSSPSSGGSPGNAGGSRAAPWFR